MSVDEVDGLREYCLEMARRAKRAAGELTRVTGGQKNDWLRRSARLLGERRTALTEANRLDLDAAPGFGLTEAQVDRLRLTPDRIDSIARALEEVAMLADPVGEVMHSSIRPNGLEVQKVRVPLGVIFFIYESRPNVTADAAALCVKSGNAVILRGGKEAAHSNAAIAQILAEAAADAGLPGDAVGLVDTPDREAVGHFLNLPEYIDVVIPRGGEGLIRRVTAEAKMPVIKHYAGNCHVYLDRSADPDMAERLVVNAKCQRMGVCNAAESLVVHGAVAATLLPQIGKTLAERGVEICGPVQLPAHGGNCHQRPGCRPAVRRPHRQLGGDDQRQHAVQRWGRVRPGGRDRHQHRQVPRPGTLRYPRADQLQVRGLRLRTGAGVKSGEWRVVSGEW